MISFFGVFFFLKAHMDPVKPVYGQDWPGEHRFIEVIQILYSDFPTEAIPMSVNCRGLHSVLIYAK